MDSRVRIPLFKNLQVKIIWPENELLGIDYGKIHNEIHFGFPFVNVMFKWGHSDGCPTGICMCEYQE